MRYFDYLRSATVALTIAWVSLLGCNQPSTATSPAAAVNSGPPDGPGLPGDSYAMGWDIRNDSVFGHGIYEHEGNTNLYASLNVLFPDGSDVVLLGNAQYNQYAIDRYTIAYKMHNAIAGLPPVKPFKVKAKENITKCQNE